MYYSLNKNLFCCKERKTIIEINSVLIAEDTSSSNTRTFFSISSVLFYMPYKVEILFHMILFLDLLYDICKRISSSPFFNQLSFVGNLHKCLLICYSILFFHSIRIIKTYSENSDIFRKSVFFISDILVRCDAGR